MQGVHGGPASGASTDSEFGSFEIARLTGAQVPFLVGVPIDQIAAFACDDGGCHVIASQIDERDQFLHWVLDTGPQTGTDDDPGRFDSTDELIFRAVDAGLTRNPPGALPGEVVAELRLIDPIGQTRWAYLAKVAPASVQTAPSAALSYDPDADRLSGAGVVLGFTDGVPQFLTLNDGPNLLDRLKIRASATALFGLLRFLRTEDDLQTEFLGWRRGPLRLIRAQRQRVRLGWGVRSPAFVSYTYFYGDHAEMPVGFRLNFPPTYFFGDVRVKAILDFRDLRGWEIWTPGVPAPLRITGEMSADKQSLGNSDNHWVILRGPESELALRFDVSPSLVVARRRLSYDERQTSGEAPDPVAGSLPAVGFEIDRWEPVAAGSHELCAAAYLLPAQADEAEFVRRHDAPLRLDIAEKRTVPAP